VSRVSAGDPARKPGLWPDLAPWRSSQAFRLLFASRTVIALGTQASEVALLVQAKQLTGSPLAVGLLGVVELVPLVVFGLYGGVLADRFDRRPLIRWCEAALGGCAVLLLVNALLPAPALWPLYAVTAVMMAAAALQRPSLDASVPRLVPREQLTAASALMSLSQNACFLLGSALGGALAVTPGPRSRPRRGGWRWPGSASPPMSTSPWPAWSRRARPT
jgi:MFS family permease